LVGATSRAEGPILRCNVLCSMFEPGSIPALGILTCPHSAQIIAVTQWCNLLSLVLHWYSGKLPYFTPVRTVPRFSLSRDTARSLFFSGYPSSTPRSHLTSGRKVSFIGTLFSKVLSLGAADWSILHPQSPSLSAPKSSSLPLNITVFHNPSQWFD